MFDGFTVKVFDKNLAFVASTTSIGGACKALMFKRIKLGYAYEYDEEGRFVDTYLIKDGEVVCCLDD